MKVSVVLCTCNGCEFIERQLISILNQTMMVDEIIICDDKSEDDTIGIAKKILIKYKVIYKIMQNESRLGVSKNFEQGCLNAQGDYIFFSDQDDIWLEDKVEKIIKEFERSQAMLIFTNAYLFHEDEKDVYKSTLWDIISFEKNVNFIQIIKRGCVTGATMAIDRSLLELAVPFSKHCYHDYWLSLCASICNRIAYIDECLIYYRQHSNNQVGATKSIRKRFNKVLKLGKQYYYDTYWISKEVISNFSESLDGETKRYLDKCLSFYQKIVENKSMFYLMKLQLKGEFRYYENGFSSFIKAILILVFIKKES